LRRGTVPGAVATGSLAPGRYRSRYHTRALLPVHPIENRSWIAYLSFRGRHCRRQTAF